MPRTPSHTFCRAPPPARCAHPPHSKPDRRRKRHNIYGQTPAPSAGHPSGRRSDVWLCLQNHPASGRVLRSSPHVPGAKVPTPDVFRKIPFRPALKYSYVSPSFFFPFSVPFHTIILILRCFINNPPRTERQKTPQKGFSPRCRVSFTSRYFFFYLKYSTPDSNSLKSCSP